MNECCGYCSYHDNAFVSSRALHIANKLNASATYDLLELFFKHQVNDNPQFILVKSAIGVNCI